jgi:hypothetical protein
MSYKSLTLYLTNLTEWEYLTDCNKRKRFCKTIIILIIDSYVDFLTILQFFITCRLFNKHHKKIKK